MDRVFELWDGKKDIKKGKPGNNNVKVSQPISGQTGSITSQTMNNYTDGTAISSLPTYDAVQGNQNSMQPQQLPNYDAMYRQDNTPLVGAATPSGTSEGFSEPMAANSVLGGGSSWGSW